MYTSQVWLDTSQVGRDSVKEIPFHPPSLSWPWKSSIVYLLVLLLPDCFLSILNASTLGLPMTALRTTCWLSRMVLTRAFLGCIIFFIYLRVHHLLHLFYNLSGLQLNPDLSEVFYSYTVHQSVRDRVTTNMGFSEGDFQSAILACL